MGFHTPDLFSAVHTYMTLSDNGKSVCVSIYGGTPSDDLLNHAGQNKTIVTSVPAGYTILSDAAMVLEMTALP